MLSATQREILESKTLHLLAELGLKVESDEIESLMLGKGCKQAPSGRIRIPSTLIREMTAFQQVTQAKDNADQELHYHYGVDWTHHIVWHGRQEEMRQLLSKRFRMPAFDCGPTKYFDDRDQQLHAVDTEAFIEAKKFAQATEEIGYISTWYRQDVPPKIERLDSLVLGLQYTHKLDGIEAIYPEVIKYLKEMSEILTGKPGDSSFLAGSECMTMPLILESRSAADILARKAAGVHRYHVASMPTGGVSTPVTIAGSVVMGAAEVLGGMAACWCVDPESDLSGRMVAAVADMRTAVSHYSAPETTMVNLAVRELFDSYLGRDICGLRPFFSPHSHRPGLQAVSENLLGQWRASKLLGIPGLPYPGMGTLGDGSIGSLSQFILDMEIRKAQFATHADWRVDADSLAFEEICEAVREGKDFLTSEHTLEHFRDLWSSKVLLAPDLTGDYEKKMLGKCREAWQENLSRWQPPDWPEDKMRELKACLERAKKELLDE